MWIKSIAKREGWPATKKIRFRPVKEISSEEDKEDDESDDTDTEEEEVKAGGDDTDTEESDDTDAEEREVEAEEEEVRSCISYILHVLLAV